ncbi:NACHT, LRR and PYD domains-containing protein 14-like [Aulostomus maculatus]
MMDLQMSLKTAVKEKFQKIKEASSENTFLPLQLCQRVPKHEYQKNKYIIDPHQHSRTAFESVPLTDIFSCDCKHDASKRTFITLGMCGAGKTVVVQNCILEWAEGIAYRDVHLLFPFTFWELNLLNCKLSLIELVQMFYPTMKELDFSSLLENNICFVFDGLDDYHSPLNFSCSSVSDVSQAATVDCLVTNLVMGNLIPRAHVWIISGYAAATAIPSCYLLKETEVPEFTDEQVEKHFRRVINSDALANKVIDHVKISKTLQLVCCVPPVSAIVANVLKNHLKADDGLKFNPLNLTQIYTDILQGTDSEFMAKLKKLALYGMEEGSVIYPHDLLQNNISLKEASLFSKEWPLVLREEKGLHGTTVFRFSHFSMKEFLAASCKLDQIEASSTKSIQCQDLVDQALQSPEGASDFFLRFIFGLLKERRVLESADPLFKYTKKKIKETLDSTNAVGLSHCLWEYDSKALLLEVNSYPTVDLSPLQKFMLKCTYALRGAQEIFDLAVAKRSDEHLLSQLPAMWNSKKAMLRFCNLTDNCCTAVAAVLSSSLSSLKQLDLGFNNISASGVRNLLMGLTDENCTLKSLRLQGCELNSQACQYLAMALKRCPTLQELDLSGNYLQDDGLKYLAEGLSSPQCHLKTLRLSQCFFRHMGCYYLATACQKNPSYLRVLDVSLNMIGDKGAREILEGIDTKRLRKLEMSSCSMTWLSCEIMGRILQHQKCSLEELNLSFNKLKDRGFKLICQGMYAWSCLKKLNVSKCGFTSRSCMILAKALCSISQLYHGGRKEKDWLALALTHLDVSNNCLTDELVNEMSAALRNPYGHLKTLNLSNCCLLPRDCYQLAAGIAFEETSITELDLSCNDIEDIGVKKLCVGLEKPQCKLVKLSIIRCALTSTCVKDLTTALRANPSHLVELLVMGNCLDDAAIRELMDRVKNQRYALHTIDVSID